MVETIHAICLRERRGQQKTNLRARPIERTLDYRESCREQNILDRTEGEFWKQTVHLFNVARMPQRYPEIKDKPPKGLKGISLFSWIAVRVGVSSEEIRLLFY